MPLLLAAGAAALLVAAPTAQAALSRAEAHSIATPQRIGGAQLERTPGGGQRLRFTIAYPRVGTGAGRGMVRVVVFDGVRRHRPLATVERKVTPRPGGTVAESVVLPRRARLRSLRAATISSYHTRNLGNGRTHTMVVGEVAARARGPLGPVQPRAKAAKWKANFSIQNTTGNALRLTATPLACMYDTANHDSYVSDLNAVTIGAGETITQAIQADQQAGDKVNGFYKTGGYGAVGQSPDYSPIIDPAYANGLYNANVRGFAFAAVNRYTSDHASPTTYNTALGKLPNKEDYCSEEAGHKFGIGVDQFTSGSDASTTQVPVRAHVAAMMSMEGDNKVELQAGLDPSFPNNEPWISLAMSGGETLVVSPTAGGGDTPCNGGPDWVSCQFPRGSAKEATPLYNVALPGSHDSVTGNLMSNGDWMLDPSSYADMKPCSDYSSLYQLTPGRVYNLAATQNYGIADQLDMGIRYLDLRSAYTDNKTADGTSRSWSEDNPTWRPLHTMFAQSTVASEAQWIATWAAAHPDEIVVADYNHVCPGPAPPAQGADGNSYNTQSFINALKTPDPVTGASLCDRGYVLQPGQTMSTLPATTIQQMRASGRNVVVLLDPGKSDSPLSYDPTTTGQCGFYPLYDQTDPTNSNGAGVPGNVPINHLWPEENGPGVCGSNTTDNNAAPADRIQKYPMSSASKDIGNAATLPTYRTVSATNPNVPLTQTQTQYTVSDVGDVIDEVVGCGSLLAYEQQYTQNYRNPVIADTGYDAEPNNASSFVSWSSGKNWADYLNLVIGDAVDNDYISTVTQINANRGP